jgi:hypothetical protein
MNFPGESDLNMTDNNDFAPETDEGVSISTFLAVTIDRKDRHENADD